MKNACYGRTIGTELMHAEIEILMRAKSPEKPTIQGKGLKRSQTGATKQRPHKLINKIKINNINKIIFN